MSGTRPVRHLSPSSRFVSVLGRLYSNSRPTGILGSRRGVDLITNGPLGVVGDGSGDGVYDGPRGTGAKREGIEGPEK